MATTYSSRFYGKCYQSDNQFFFAYPCDGGFTDDTQVPAEFLPLAHAALNGNGKNGDESESALRKLANAMNGESDEEPWQPDYYFRD